MDEETDKEHSAISLAKDSFLRSKDGNNMDKTGDHSYEVTLFDLPWEDVIMVYILPCLPLQTQFHLRQVSSLGYELIKEYFAKSKCVNVARVGGRMTQTAFHILTADNSSITEINLRNAKDWLNDATLISVLKSNPKLESLDLTKCSSLTNTCLQVLAVNCTGLKTLMLNECPWVSPDGLTVIALNCVNLEVLDIAGCWNVNNDALQVLAMSCIKLKSLSLSKIYGVNDEAFTLIIRRCPLLNYINIQGCWRLTDDSLRFLVEYSRHLKILRIRECHQVSEMLLSELRDRGVKMDRLPPPSGNIARLHRLGSKLRHGLNVAI